jgi:UMP-CMP kinase
MGHSVSKLRNSKNNSKETSNNQLTFHDLDVLFVDCDDTIYFNDWSTASRLKEKISDFTTKKLGLKPEYAYELYQKHGTALRGLLKENLIPDNRVEEFLHLVHDISLEEITRNSELREMFLKIPIRRWIFTASSREHGLRCMKQVGIEDLFEGIIDCRTVNLITKHDEEAFRIAMETAGVSDPKRCMILDDSVQNIQTAKKIGMRTCLVGLKTREIESKEINCPEADYSINRLNELSIILPGLFSNTKKLSTIQGRRYSSIALRHLSIELINNKKKKPEIIFVLGGPGVGKGTQCILSSKKYNALHLSAGELLRQEEKNPNSKYGEIITKHMKNGTIVPVEITCQLILNAIFNKTCDRVLLDGFPRSIDNLDGWFREAHDVVKTLGVLYYEVKDEEGEKELVRRIIERGKTSGREDDNEEVLRKRFDTMKLITLPVIQRLENELEVKKVNSLGSVEQVWEETQVALNSWWPLT